MTLETNTSNGTAAKIMGRPTTENDSHSGLQIGDTLSSKMATMNNKS